MRWNFQKTASFLLTAALASLLCLCLFNFNNKYTHPASQPENGHLIISYENQNECHYLIEDWIFYPDTLLVPENLYDPEFPHNWEFIKIGDQTMFQNPDNKQDPHGCGTYVLRLHLPEDTRTYALELPEIFSAYTLFINGEMYLQTGNPDYEHYEDKTQTKLITFRAAKQADLILAVSDYSHFYSGMVYPPVFGMPDAVMQLRDIRHGILIMAISFCLILLIPTVYLGIIMKRTNALLFACLCLCMSLTIGFPLLHTLLELPVYPWYMLELICIYFMPMLVLILHNRICDMPRKYRITSMTAACTMWLIACGYGQSACGLSIPVIQLFSKLVFLYKLGLAAYLLITAYIALNAGINQARPLYYASIAYAVIFLWDRIFPEYEPILYGWFNDWANLVVITAIGFSLLHDMVTSYFKGLAFAEEHRQMTRQLVMQNAYSRQLAEQSEQNRRLIHDFRQHLRTISGFINRIKPLPEHLEMHAELCTYLNQVSDTAVSQSFAALKPFSNNSSVDALLQYYYAYARQQNIDTEFRLVNAALNLTDIEYCTLLGNLLENAIDACIRLPETATRQIQLSSKETDYLLFIRIENTYDGTLLKKGNLFYSRKTGAAFHGIGMESAREIVERHGGNLDIYPLQNIFRIGIILPLKNSGD